MNGMENIDSRAGPWMLVMETDLVVLQLPSGGLAPCKKSDLFEREKKYQTPGSNKMKRVN